MSDLEELPELEPVAPAAPQIDYQAATFQRLIAGAPAPAFNPSSSKEYYRFLFAGVLIVVGCLMPFDSDWSHVGYKSFVGGCWLIIGLGLVWSMWAAINTGVLRMKWTLLCFLPLVWGILSLFVWPQWPAATPEAGIDGWGTWFSAFADTGDKDRFSKMGNALQHLGPGRILIFLGSLIAVLSFVGGIFSGAKRIKEQKAERVTARRR